MRIGYVAVVDCGGTPIFRGFGGWLCRQGMRPGSKQCDIRVSSGQSLILSRRYPPHMPELPEVETTVRILRPDLEGRHIEGASVEWERTLGGASPRAFDRAVAGCRITRVWRRGKFIVLDLERGNAAEGSILVHLRMSGRLFLDGPGACLAPHTRVRLRLDRGTLTFVDVRKFGRFTFLEEPESVLRSLGPEPLEESFTEDWLLTGLRGRRRLLKPLLLDQAFVAGIGNIYADESLHRAGLHPLRRSDRVGAAAARRLHAEIRATLAEAIEREGSSFDTFYRTPAGQPGRYQHQFRVYGRTGKPCLTCGRAITKLTVGQRGTHVCTRCQPAPRPRRRTVAINGGA